MRSGEGVSPSAVEEGFFVWQWCILVHCTRFLNVSIRGVKAKTVEKHLFVLIGQLSHMADVSSIMPYTQTHIRAVRHTCSLHYGHSRHTLTYLYNYFHVFYFKRFNSISLKLISADITGSTVVLTCCKGDSSSQWETPIFGPPQTKNPLTDLDKICHQ